MSKKTRPGGNLPLNNPVAKYAARFNRAAVLQDKTCYKRKTKHKGREPSLIGLIPDGANERRFVPLALMGRQQQWFSY